MDKASGLLEETRVLRPDARHLLQDVAQMVAQQRLGAVGIVVGPVREISVQDDQLCGVAMEDGRVVRRDVPEQHVGVPGEGLRAGRDDEVGAAGAPHLVDTDSPSPPIEFE